MQLELLSEPGCAAIVQELLADSGQHRPLAVAGSEDTGASGGAGVVLAFDHACPCAAAARDAAVAEAGHDMAWVRAAADRAPHADPRLPLVG